MILTAWFCRDCQVTGHDEPPVSCWSCGRAEVEIIASAILAEETP